MLQDYAIALAGLMGVILPLVVAFITNASVSSKVKGLLALGLSVLVGTITAIAAGELSFASLQGSPADVMVQVATYISIVAVAAQTAYNMLFKPIGWTTTLQQDFGIKEKFDYDEFTLLDDMSEVDIPDEEYVEA